MDGPSVMRAALELFRSRHYPSVVAACTDALEDEPDNNHLRLLCARAYLALRRDAEAQQQVSECLRHDPRSAPAYRILGEVALRRDEVRSAEIFFREAQRLDPGDPETHEWLVICQRMIQPTATVKKLPADAVAVGCPLVIRSEPAKPAPQAVAPAPAPPPPRPPPTAVRRVARGTEAGGEPADGFGQYLVDAGIMSLLELKAALAYHRSTGVRFGRAAVVLGFVSEPKLEWAAVAYHASHRKDRKAHATG